MSGTALNTSINIVVSDTVVRYQLAIEDSSVREVRHREFAAGEGL
jgi:hypothetical protein